LDQCWTWLDSLRICCVTHFQSLVYYWIIRATFRCGMGKINAKSAYKTSGSLMFRLLLPLDFQVKNTNLCLVMPGKTRIKIICLCLVILYVRNTSWILQGEKHGVWFPVGKKYISFVQAIQTASEAHPSPYSNGYSGS
jgi:hypothetical protein